MSEANVFRMKKWLSAVGVIVAVFGMLGLASYITARPDEAMRLAGKFGGFIWALLAAISLVMLWVKKRSQMHPRGGGHSSSE